MRGHFITRQPRIINSFVFYNLVIKSYQFYNLVIKSYQFSKIYYGYLQERSSAVQNIDGIYRASHIILDYLQSLTPKYAHNTRQI